MEGLVVRFSEQDKNEMGDGSSSLEIHYRENSVQLELFEKIVPKAGIILGSEEEGYNFYLEYAVREGFDITKKRHKIRRLWKIEVLYANMCKRWLTDMYIKKLLQSKTIN